MQTKYLIISMGLAGAVASLGHSAADKDAGGKATASEKAFILKAANGGMAEVELGKVAGDKGASSEVKDFGAQSNIPTSWTASARSHA